MPASDRSSIGQPAGGSDSSGLYVAIRSKAYRSPAGVDQEVLRSINFQVAKGETVVLFGRSGIGKSTCLSVIAGLDRSFDGTIGFAVDQPKIGMVFQEPRLMPWLTVRDNLALVLGKGQPPGGKIEDVLTTVGLADAIAQHANRLSLGMARRAALARALVIEPDILLLDEPFVSIDDQTAMRLRALLGEILNTQKPTALLVTHNPWEAAELADRIIVLDGVPATIAATLDLDRPRSERTEAWLREQADRLRRLVRKEAATS